ncbi:hypothetical protein KOR34_07560 [Posidoniimonas corsicana]|uniref:DUF58 domain-containing protein n=1 Tax=Posidoniimonas corsicana TaxID=1938618 RepID=A0A5C5VD09_9BACT|nr:DUF58 domain-containing protein [Posidoniimonas corsicana]TWT35860.1 hypothetical protein KOR34_07560 [Posidoniimonas corsicana]
MAARTTVTLEELMLLQADARGFSLQSRQPAGSLLAGRHASRLRGRGLTFEELRQYHQGDDIRTMDWKATARLRSPQVRVYAEERERPVLLVVDQRQTMYFGSRRAMKSVAAAEVAALGAWRAIKGGDRVGGLVFNEHEIVEVRPHRSRTRVMQLLSAVQRLNCQLAEPPASGDVTLDGVLRRAAQVAKHDHLVVLISDLDGAGDETKRLASQLAAHNDVLVAAVYDPLGASLTGSPGMLAADRGQSWEVAGGASFAREFWDTFQQRLDEWREVFRALRVPLLPISTARPVVDQVREMFGGRGSTA